MVARAVLLSRSSKIAESQRFLSSISFVTMHFGGGGGSPFDAFFGGGGGHPGMGGGMGGQRERIMEHACVSLAWRGASALALNITQIGTPLRFFRVGPPQSLSESTQFGPITPK